MQRLERYLRSLGHEEKTTADAVEKFRVYRDFLREQNELFNLTAITDPDEIVTKHFIDSLAALPYVHGDVADIGTGAGFPGLPLAVLAPQCRFTLIDSLQKRIGFLRELTEKLGLENVRCIHARAEDLPKSETYDVIVSRAVAHLSTLSEYCLPFLRTGGLFIAYKAADCDEEVQTAQNAVSLLGGKLQEIKRVPLYDTDIVRALVLIRKIKETPQKYPRNGNKPKKSPL